MRRGAPVLSVIVLLASCCAATAQSTAQQFDERCIETLVAASLGNVYHEDGAGDGTILMAGQLVGSGPYVRPHPAVRAIVDLHERAIPILIYHLDDSRRTATTFDKKPVPLGHLALDILMGIVSHRSRFFVPGCADDGLGACVKRGYYFRPDASALEMRHVKAKWEAAYRKKQLQFVYPDCWK